MLGPGPTSQYPQCKCIHEYLTHKPQTERMGDKTASMIILNTSAPQEWVLSPLLYSLYAHSCGAKFSLNPIHKGANDTTVVGWISNNGETEYSKEIENLVMWCQDNLSLNVSNTTELVIDFSIQGTEVEMVESFKFLAQVSIIYIGPITSTLWSRKHINASTPIGDLAQLRQLVPISTHCSQ